VGGSVSLTYRYKVAREIPRAAQISGKDVSEKLPEVLTPNESASTMSNE
jgi:hypothetical protein